jgi:hypothetical protein
LNKRFQFNIFAFIQLNLNRFHPKCKHELLKHFKKTLSSNKYSEVLLKSLNLNDKISLGRLVSETDSTQPFSSITLSRINKKMKIENESNDNDSTPSSPPPSSSAINTLNYSNSIINNSYQIFFLFAF